MASRARERFWKYQTGWLVETESEDWGGGYGRTGTAVVKDGHGEMRNGRMVHLPFPTRRLIA